MADKFKRRDFVNRLTMGTLALLATPYKGLAEVFKSTSKNTTPMNNEDIVLNVKPMGFQWETADPFLFCVHHEDKYPKGNDKMEVPTSLDGRHIGNDFIVKDGYRMYHGKKIPGFPGHPHRGFETITLVREGVIDHADSMGAAGRYGDGDVQWMTAGKGVQHSEMFPLVHTDKENPVELFQIWLNLPKKDKMVEPHFKMFWNKTIPIHTQKDDNDKSTEIEVFVGSIANHTPPTPPPDSWASNIENEVAVWNIKLEAGAQYTLPKASAGVNRNLYYYKGDSITIAGKKVDNYHAVEVKPDTPIELQNGDTEARILVLQGKPINEHVIQYGPFVMNSKEEIQQAFDDYHKTGFGGWPWPRTDQVHDIKEGRFALHADGTKEIGL